MLRLLLLTLAAAPATPTASRLDSALLSAGDVAPDCHLDSTLPLDAQGGAAQLSHAEAALEQLFSCKGDIGIVDYFDMGKNADEGVQQLEQSRWGGPQPPTRLHDGLLRRKSVLTDVSGSRATVFLLQTKLQARDFRLLGSSSADYAAIETQMGEDLAARAKPISGRVDLSQVAHGDRGEGIEWLGYEEGLREAASSHRPVCLYFYTTWCPHCRNFEKVLQNPKVVEKSRSFVMVKLNDEKDDALARKYSPDGRYFPRMLFLSSDGELDPTVTNGSLTHRYTVSENDPKFLLFLMKRALAKVGR